MERHIMQSFLAQERLQLNHLKPVIIINYYYYYYYFQVKLLNRQWGWGRESL